VEHLINIIENVPVQMDATARQVRVNGETTEVPRPVDVVEVIVLPKNWTGG
jgi:hypothetical protein